MKTLLTILSALAVSLMAHVFAADTAEIARLRETADSLHSIGRTDSALIVGAKAITLANESGDPTLIVGAHSAQGVFLRSSGKIDEALKSYETALEIVTSGKFRENPDREAIEEIASLYINLAVLNLDMQSKEQAAKNAEMSGKWIEKSDDPSLKSTVMGVIGSVLTGCGLYQKAAAYQDKAYGYALDAGDNESAFRSAAYAMLVSDRTGDKTQADDWREKCNRLIDSIQSSMALLTYYQAECSICLKNDDNKGSLAWFDKILKLDGIDNLPFVVFDCYNNMHIAYAALGDYRKAYDTLLKSNELRDTIWQQQKADSLRDLTVKYETKETELALAQSEARRANTLMWLAVATGLLLAGLILFLIYVNRQRRLRMMKEMEFSKLKADIARQLTQQYVEGLENERRRMARELHDGVCNDLLAIQMNMSNGQPIESTARLIDSCRESVRRISHELMPPEFAYATLDEVIRFFINKQAGANRGKIDFTYSSSCQGADWADIPDAVSLEIYRIIQEAVGNAIRHSGASEVKVSLDFDRGDITASVADNGTYRQNSRKGLGIDSIRRRAGSINGSVCINASESGTDITLNVII